MKHYLIKYPYTLLKKMLCLIASFFFAITSVSSQTTLPENAKLKTIEYSDYTISGYIDKKQFVNGQDLTILSLKTQDTIVSGTYTVNENSAYINGIWKRNSDKGITHTIGLFKVSNCVNQIGLTLKPKKADSLQIQVDDVYFYYGYRGKYPATLYKMEDNNYSLTVNYSSGDIGEWIVSNNLIKKYGFFAIDDFMFFTTDLKYTYKNGNVFTGKVENTNRTSDNNFKGEFREGKTTYISGNIDEDELTKQSDGNYKYQVKYSERNADNPFSELELIVSQSLIDKYGFWATSDYIYNTPDVKYTYKNGNVFIGKVKNTKDSITNAVESNLTVGVLIYPTGEKFQGDLSGKWYCDIPILGRMTFLDGSIKNGNWLEKYNLNQEEYDKVLKGKSPTEKLSIAEGVYKEKQYQDALNKAETAFSKEYYKIAKDWYLNALFLNPTDSIQINKKIIKIEKLIVEETRKDLLKNKYGDYWGNLIFKKEYTPGMTKEMVLEFTNENYYKISKLIRNGNSIEIWEFDRQKMELETLKESGKDGAQALLALSLMENLGFGNIKSKFPTIVFTNAKLTDVYQY